MDDPAVTAKQLVDLAKKHIEDQQCRIVRQRELLAKYELTMIWCGYQVRALFLSGCRNSLLK